MKYFAMIGDRQIGPFDLEDVVAQGVRPDTYVWCKGMPDWAMAMDVPDICRYFRQRLSGSLPAVASPVSDSFNTDIQEQEELIGQLPPRLQGFVRRSGVKLTKESLPVSEQRHHSRTLPVILYIICILLIILGIALN